MTSLADDGLSEAGRHHKNGVHPSFGGGLAAVAAAYG